MQTPKTVSHPSSANDTDQRPALDVRRKILTEKRDSARAVSFDAEMELESAAVQTVGVDAKNRAEVEKELTTRIANCRAAAARLDELLRALPDAEPTP